MVCMDFTSVTLGKQVRDDLADFRDRNDLPNYNEAIRALLAETDDKPTPEISN